MLNFWNDPIRNIYCNFTLTANNFSSISYADLKIVPCNPNTALDIHTFWVRTLKLNHGISKPCTRTCCTGSDYQLAIQRYHNSEEGYLLRKRAQQKKINHVLYFEYNLFIYQLLKRRYSDIKYMFTVFKSNIQKTKLFIIRNLQ